MRLSAMEDLQKSQVPVQLTTRGREGGKDFHPVGYVFDVNYHQIILSQAPSTEKNPVCLPFKSHDVANEFVAFDTSERYEEIFLRGDGRLFRSLFYLEGREECFYLEDEPVRATLVGRNGSQIPYAGYFQGLEFESAGNSRLYRVHLAMLPDSESSVTIEDRGRRRSTRKAKKAIVTSPDFIKGYDVKGLGLERMIVDLEEEEEQSPSELDDDVVKDL